MDCGTGKTLLAKLIEIDGLELLSLNTDFCFMDSLRDWGFKNVVTAVDARSDWKIGEEIPNIVVATYSNLARAYSTLHGNQGDMSDPLLWMLCCKPFGVLILDEVHIAAADHFRVACSMPARVVWPTALFERMIDETNEQAVGPVLQLPFGSQA